MPRRNGRARLIVAALLAGLGVTALAAAQQEKPASPALRAQLTTARTEALHTLGEVTDRWTHRRVSGRFSPERIARIERQITIQRLRLPRAQLPDTLTAAAAEERLQAIRGVVRELAKLSNRMAYSRPGEIRGIWFHIYAPQNWDPIMAKIKAAGLNAVFIRVGRGGNVIYPSEILPMDAWAEKLTSDHLVEAIEAAHRHGLAFHAWRVNFHMGSAPKEYYAKMAAADRLVRDPQGEQAYWLNPGDPRNLDQEYRVMMELVRKYDIDGLHLDYIRYPDAPHYDFDYGAVSRREFEKTSGRVVDDWPEAVISGPRKREYEDWERSNINSLVKRVHEGLRQEKPWLPLSAAVWRNHRRYRAAIKQDWMLWARKGWVDFLVPMDYTPNLDTFAATVEAQTSVTRGNIPLVAGIGNYLARRPEDVVRQVEIARREGADGFVLFAYNHTDIDNQLAALRAGATATDTFPNYLAPPVEWTVSPTRADKDRPLAVIAGQEIRISLRLGRRSPRPSSIRSVVAELVLEDDNDATVRRLGAVNGFGKHSFSVSAPAGRFRPALHGQITYADGVTAPLLVRGPLIEGLSAPQMERRKQADEPPRLKGSGRAVGVYMAGYGSFTLLDLLTARPELEAVRVHRLRRDHLAGLKTLVLPQLNDVTDLSEEAEVVLRRWVQRGGTLMLTHDAVGARWHPRMFPKIGMGVGFSGVQQYQLKRAIGELKLGALGEHAYVDHVRIRPGERGEVWIREAGLAGAPVVVVGKLGRGRVILNGMVPGFGAQPMTESEQALFLALVSLQE